MRAMLVVLIVISSLWARDKEYPLTLEVLETDAISSKADGTRTTTTCTSIPGLSEITCDSRHVDGAVHTELVSYATGSDGKAYLISCVPGVGRAFLSGAGQAMQANSGLPTVSGCAVPPGTYKARWDKGRLRVLHDASGKFRETTFAILSSVAKPRADATAPDREAEKTFVKSSNPYQSNNPSTSQQKQPPAEGMYVFGGSAEKLVKDCKTTEKMNVDRMIFEGSASDQFEAGYCLGFVGAIVDGESLLGETQGKRFCVPMPDATGGQLAKVVAKYGDDHPEQLHFPGVAFVIVALQTAFPCK